MANPITVIVRQDSEHGTSVFGPFQDDKAADDWLLVFHNFLDQPGKYHITQLEDPLIIVGGIIERTFPTKRKEA